MSFEGKCLFGLCTNISFCFVHFFACKCVTMKFKCRFCEPTIPRYLYSETCSILCPVHVVICKPSSAIFLALENVVLVVLSALRINSILKEPAL